MAEYYFLYLIGAPGADTQDLLTMALRQGEWIRPIHVVPPDEFSTSGMAGGVYWTELLLPYDATFYAARLGWQWPGRSRQEGLAQTFRPRVLQWLRKLSSPEGPEYLATVSTVGPEELERVRPRMDGDVIVVGEHNPFISSAFLRGVLQLGWHLSLVYYAGDGKRPAQPKIQKIIEEFNPLTLQDDDLPRPVDLLRAHPYISRIRDASKRNALAPA